MGGIFRSAHQRSALRRRLQRESTREERPSAAPSKLLKSFLNFRSSIAIKRWPELAQELIAACNYCWWRGFTRFTKFTGFTRSRRGGRGEGGRGEGGRGGRTGVTCSGKPCRGPQRGQVPRARARTTFLRVHLASLVVQLLTSGLARRLR